MFDETAERCNRIDNSTCSTPTEPVESIAHLGVLRGDWPAVSESDSLDKTRAMFLRTINEQRTQLIWFTKRIVGSRQAAEDVVQDSLLKAFCGLPHFRGDAKMGTGLRAIARNQAIEYLKRERRPVRVSLEQIFDGDFEQSAYEPPDPRKTPEESLEAKEMYSILFAEIDTLSHDSRHAIQVCLLDGQPHILVAAALNVSTGTIKARVHRAKRILTARMRDRKDLTCKDSR